MQKLIRFERKEIRDDDTFGVTNTSEFPPEPISRGQNTGEKNQEFKVEEEKSQKMEVNNKEADESLLGEK